MQWSKGRPVIAGDYWMRCLETDNEPERVKVTWSTVAGLLIADSQHLGLIQLKYMHENLTDIEWKTATKVKR